MGRKRQKCPKNLKNLSTTRRSRFASRPRLFMYKMENERAGTSPLLSGDGRRVKKQMETCWPRGAITCESRKLITATVSM